MPIRSLTITIVNHNHGRWIQDCLASIEKHPYTLGPFEIVVLDNASEDGSTAAIRDQFPDVTLIPQTRRRGFGANQNKAVSAATTDLVFILNPDAVVHARTLDLLARAFDADDSIAASAGPDTGSDYSLPINGPLPFPTSATALKRALRLNRRGSDNLVDEDGLISNGWVSGHAFMVDRHRFIEAGGFDTGYFMYSEEVDLMFRMRNEGWMIAWVDGALTTHVGKTSESATGDAADFVPGAVPERTTVQFARSELRYARKNQGMSGSVTFRAASALDAGIRYAATWIPWAGSSMVAKGPTIDHTRAYHLTRLRVFLGDTSTPDMADGADKWNRLNGTSAQS